MRLLFKAQTFTEKNYNNSKDYSEHNSIILTGNRRSLSTTSFLKRLTMENSDKVIFIFLSSFIIIPMAGVITTLFKLLLKLRTEPQKRPLAKIATFSLLLYAVGLESFFIVIFWFKDVISLPGGFKLLGLLLSIPFLVCILSIMYGLGPVIGISGISSKKIFHVEKNSKNND